MTLGPMMFREPASKWRTTTMHTAVWKIGGSLMHRCEFASRLVRLLDDARASRVLLVPGGGIAADSVRDWQKRANIDDHTAHWLAIQSMDMNAGLVAAKLSRGEVVATPVQASGCWQRGVTPVLSPTAWLLQQEREQFVLPHSWAVTSDSIAAWVALKWSFNELVLLKSCSIEKGITLAAAAERGLVDDYFPQVARDVTQIWWCNLRDHSPQIVPWLSHGKEETQG